MGLLGTFPRRAFFQPPPPFRGPAASPASSLAEFGSPSQTCSFFGGGERKKNPLAARCRMPQGAGGVPVQRALHPGAGHSWHRVAPCKKNREPSKKKKQNHTKPNKKPNKEDSLPRPRLLFPGEQTVGDSRAGAWGEQALHCATPAGVRAGFVRPPCRHPAVARGGCQRGVARTTAPARLGFGDGGEGGKEEQAAPQASGLPASIDACGGSKSRG